MRERREFKEGDDGDGYIDSDDGQAIEDKRSTRQ